MSIENDIRQYLNNELKNLTTKTRDIELILYYYGFGSALWPTLEDAAIEFDVGESDGRRSERPRQIINTKFRKKAKFVKFPSLVNFIKILASSTVHSSDELAAQCLKDGLMDEKGNLISLLRLMHDLGEAKSYAAYSFDLNDLTRNSYNKSQDILIAEKESAKSLRNALIKSKTIPGLIGISKLSYLTNKHEIGDVDTEILVSIIKRDPDSWFYNYQGDDYYLFESRDNTLTNSLGKIKNIANSENINILTETLSNSLTKRTPPKSRNYPPKDVVKKYLLSSKYTNINGDVVSITAEPEDLTKIERDVIKYMQETHVDDYPTISVHLNSLGHTKPLIDKAVFKSPLIHVDKREGRAHYKYRLVGLRSINLPEKQSIYEVFRQRLLKASSEGTNGNSEITTRKEHHILKEWLFKGKESERCAICNNTYSVKSLVTAHKKRRADCAENERTDPYIVMPVCNFGCDYLYEQGLIYIDNGIIHAADVIEGKYYDELPAINALTGKTIEQRWLEGNESYFKKPNKKK